MVGRMRRNDSASGGWRCGVGNLPRCFSLWFYWVIFVKDSLSRFKIFLHSNGLLRFSYEHGAKVPLNFYGETSEYGPYADTYMENPLESWFPRHQLRLDLESCTNYDCRNRNQGSSDECLELMPRLRSLVDLKSQSCDTF